VQVGTFPVRKSSCIRNAILNYWKACRTAVDTKQPLQRGGSHLTVSDGPLLLQDAAATAASKAGETLQAAKETVTVSLFCNLPLTYSLSFQCVLLSLAAMSLYLLLLHFWYVLLQWGISASATCNALQLAGFLHGNLCTAGKQVGDELTRRSRTSFKSSHLPAHCMF